MTKYARIENGKTIDVVATPDPLPAWAADDAAQPKQLLSLGRHIQAAHLSGARRVGSRRVPARREREHQ